MNTEDFVALCKKTIADYFNSHKDKTDNAEISDDDVFVCLGM